MQRLYEQLIQHHFLENRQMVFLAGPRQVGKTTLSKMIGQSVSHFYYLNWDNTDHQRIILAGPAQVVAYFNIQTMTESPGIIIFDELHKYSRWKQFLKGFFDTYGDLIKILVTGSAKLDVYKKIGDSLMGRYFLYRIHPFSVAEMISPSFQDTELKKPLAISNELFQQLIEYGGFPEPLLKANKRFYTRWSRLRYDQTFHEDIRNLIQVHEIAQLEMLAAILKNQAGALVNFSNLAQAITVSTPTIKRWINSLSAFYYCYTVRPWFKNVTRALVKQPKIYLWDWSEISDLGARLENFIASHLLKAVHFWTDSGLGDYGLYFLRDKEQREVDFLVTKNGDPWFLVEVKHSKNAGINPSLHHFQKQTGAPHAFQVVFDLPFVAQDCFSYTTPVIVPAQTLLAQLV